MRRGGIIVALAVAGLVAGCENSYEALTAAPPGMVATLNNEDKSLVLSKGVSLAFECTANGSTDPCGHDFATANPEVALVFPADVDTLTKAHNVNGPADRAVFVVVGISAGHSDVRAGGGSLGVTVLAPDR